LLRDGNAEAIADFVRQYGSYMRRAIRAKLNQHSLQPAADSIDVCQSVMGSFLFRLTAGEYHLECEDQMRRLLATIVRNKFLMLLRRELADRRDRGRTKSISERAILVDHRADHPSDAIVLAELRQKAILKLSEHEQLLLGLRMDGRSWETISRQLQLDAQILRKRLSRAINRVSQELGLWVDDESE
jgi:DNA-directed RNA polymerase specialized sigma24 family protein